MHIIDTVYIGLVAVLVLHSLYCNLNWKASDAPEWFINVKGSTRYPDPSRLGVIHYALDLFVALL